MRRRKGKKAFVFFNDDFAPHSANEGPGSVFLLARSGASLARATSTSNTLLRAFIEIKKLAKDEVEEDWGQQIGRHSARREGGFFEEGGVCVVLESALEWDSQ